MSEDFIAFDVLRETKFAGGTNYGRVTFSGVDYVVMGRKKYDDLCSPQEMISQEIALGWLNCFRMWDGLEPHSNMVYAVDPAGFSFEEVADFSAILESIWISLPPRVLEDDCWVAYNAWSGAVVCEPVQSARSTWHELTDGFIAYNHASTVLRDLVIDLNPAVIYAPCDYGYEVYASCIELNCEVKSYYWFAVPGQEAKVPKEVFSMIRGDKIRPDVWIVFRKSCMDVVMATNCGMVNYTCGHTIGKVRHVGVTILQEFRTVSKEHPFFSMIRTKKVDVIKPAPGEFSVVLSGRIKEIVPFVVSVVNGNYECVKSIVDVGAREEVSLMTVAVPVNVDLGWIEAPVTRWGSVLTRTECTERDGSCYSVLGESIWKDFRPRTVPVSENHALVELCARSVEGLDFAIACEIGNQYSIFRDYFGYESSNHRTLVCEVCGCAPDDCFSVNEAVVSDTQKRVWDGLNAKGVLTGCVCTRFSSSTMVPIQHYGQVRYVCRCGNVQCPMGTSICRSCSGVMRCESGLCGGCYYCKAVDVHQCCQFDDDSPMDRDGFPVPMFTSVCGCKSVCKKERKKQIKLIRERYDQYRIGGLIGGWYDILD